MEKGEAVRQPGQILVGVGILVIGLILLTVRISGTSFEGWWAFWPLIVIAAGISRLLGSGRERWEHSGLTLTLVGIWLLVNSLHLFGSTWDTSWPLLLILLGLGRLVLPQGRRRGFGLVMLGVGVWFTLQNYGLAGADLDRWWPLLIVLVGLSIVWRAFSERPMDRTQSHCVEERANDAT